MWDWLGEGTHDHKIPEIYGRQPRAVFGLLNVLEKNHKTILLPFKYDPLMKKQPRKEINQSFLKNQSSTDLLHMLLGMLNHFLADFYYKYGNKQSIFNTKFILRTGTKLIYSNINKYLENILIRGSISLVVISCVNHFLGFFWLLWFLFFF